MDADLDTLATALYVKIDELLKAAAELAPWRPTVGIAPKLSDAELVTLAVMQALLGFTSQARWLRYGHRHLRRLFPYLPGQSGYDKRLRRAAGLLGHAIGAVASDTALWTDDVWLVDSTRSSVAAPGGPPNARRWPDGPPTAGVPVIRAGSGAAAAPGLHPHSQPILFAVAGAKAVDREVLVELLAAEPEFES